MPSLILFQFVSSQLAQKDAGPCMALTRISIELSVRFRALLQSYEKMSRVNSTESRPILNHHREKTLAASIYDGHAVEVNNATAH
jgi:hypothetical protein